MPENKKPFLHCSKINNYSQVQRPVNYYFNQTTITVQSSRDETAFMKTYYQFKSDKKAESKNLLRQDPTLIKHSYLHPTNTWTVRRESSLNCITQRKLDEIYNEGFRILNRGSKNNDSRITTNCSDYYSQTSRKLEYNKSNQLGGLDDEHKGKIKNKKQEKRAHTSQLKLHTEHQPNFSNFPYFANQFANNI